MVVLLEKKHLDPLGTSAKVNLSLNVVVKIKFECLAVISSWNPKKNLICIWGQESEGSNRATDWTLTAKFCRAGKLQCSPQQLPGYDTKYLPYYSFLSIGKFSPKEQLFCIGSLFNLLVLHSGKYVTKTAFSVDDSTRDPNYTWGKRILVFRWTSFLKRERKYA